MSEDNEPRPIISKAYLIGGLALVMIAIGVWVVPEMIGQDIFNEEKIFNTEKFFQTAYLDGVTAGLPESERGVAGGLAMATRTIGVVAAASMLTLLFGETESSALAAGIGPEQAFSQAYALAFAIAATAAAAGAILAWTMRRST